VDSQGLSNSFCGDMDPAHLAKLYSMKLYKRAHVYQEFEMHGTMYEKTVRRDNSFARCTAYTSRWALSWSVMVLFTWERLVNIEFVCTWCRTKEEADDVVLRVMYFLVASPRSGRNAVDPSKYGLPTEDIVLAICSVEKIVEIGYRIPADWFRESEAGKQVHKALIDQRAPITVPHKLLAQVNKYGCLWLSDQKMVQFEGLGGVIGVNVTRDNQAFIGSSVSMGIKPLVKMENSADLKSPLQGLIRVSGKNSRNRKVLTPSSVVQALKRNDTSTYYADIFSVSGQR